MQLNKEFFYFRSGTSAPRERERESLKSTPKKPSSKAPFTSEYCSSQKMIINCRKKRMGGGGSRGPSKFNDV
jgi:hypothetical protein